MSNRAAELLPVPYFHVVFTLPKTLAELSLQNKAVMYDILFRATAETLKEVAANPKNLGAKIGFFAVLHTWGQLLDNHPHLHCVIPAGGVSSDGKRWKHCRRSRKDGKLFFLPVPILSEVFCGKFIGVLREAYKQGKLSFFGRFRSLERADDFERFLNASVKSKWRVYAKRPFANTECVLKYLARYTHRIAISNSRLIGIEGEKVVFRWKNYRKDGAVQIARMKGVEFLRRFLQHVLPKGYTRIRHFGILSNRLRSSVIEFVRKLMGGQTETTAGTSDHDADAVDRDDPKACPVCEIGRMVITESWERAERGTLETSLHRGLLLALDSW